MEFGFNANCPPDFQKNAPQNAPEHHVAIYSDFFLGSGLSPLSRPLHGGPRLLAPTKPFEFLTSASAQTFSQITPMSPVSAEFSYFIVYFGDRVTESVPDLFSMASSNFLRSDKVGSTKLHS